MQKGAYTNSVTPTNNAVSLLGLYLLIVLIVSTGCHSNKFGNASQDRYVDSLTVRSLLAQGDSIYGIRNQMATIGKSLFYFDSARRLAERLKDTALLATTLYFTGNVYNAWNEEPLTTIDYYRRSAELFSKFPDYVVREYYVRYLIAHAYDNEKGKDSVACMKALTTAIDSLVLMPAVVRSGMEYLSDYAWVSTNCNNYSYAETILKRIVNRSTVRNNPTSNNYLDHYYLTKARIDVYKYKKLRSPFLDSMTMALGNCPSRFDSAYYSLNLSKLYSHTGNYKEAYRYAQLYRNLQEAIGNISVVSDLQKQLLTRELQAQKEKEKLSLQEIKNKNLYLFIGGLLLLIVVLAVFLDLLSAKRKKTQKEMALQAKFTERLLQKEEEERRRIATELHDGINHDILALKNRMLLRLPVVADDLEAVSNAIREVSHNLYPAMFERIGLVHSVQALCDKMTTGGLFTTCDIRYNNELNKLEELQLYRIVQEAVTNTAKHAKAEAAKITIYKDNSELLVEFKDNGKGFDQQEEFKNTYSFGLQSMMQRAKVLGAEVFFDSNKQGTKITLRKKV